MDGWRDQHVLVFNFFGMLYSIDDGRASVSGCFQVNLEYLLFGGVYLCVCVFNRIFFVLKRGKNNGVSFEM